MGFYVDYCLPHLVNFTCRQPLFAEQRKRVVPQASGIVLDVGFGSGLNLPYYNSKSIKRLWALEPSQGMRRKALKNVTQQTLAFPMQWLALPGEQIPLDDNSIDSIVLTYTYFSIKNNEQALQQMYRVLKPGGQLFFCEHGLAPEERIISWQNYITPILEVGNGWLSFLLRVNIKSGFVANKLSGLCIPERREHESDKMATGDTTNAIRRSL